MHGWACFGKIAIARNCDIAMIDILACIFLAHLAVRLTKTVAHLLVCDVCGMTGIPAWVGGW